MLIIFIQALHLLIKRRATNLIFISPLITLAYVDTTCLYKTIFLDELQDLVCVCVFYPQIRDVVEHELNTLKYVQSFSLLRIHLSVCPGTREMDINCKNPDRHGRVLMHAGMHT